MVGLSRAPLWWWSVEREVSYGVVAAVDDYVAGVCCSGPHLFDVSGHVASCCS